VIEPLLPNSKGWEIDFVIEPLLPNSKAWEIDFVIEPLLLNPMILVTGFAIPMDLVMAAKFGDSISRR
jgi:hypothetical protein